MTEKKNNNIPTKKETKKKKTGFQLHPQHINMNGRPKKGMAITDILREYLDETDKDDKTRKEILIEKLFKMANAEDLAALKYIIDRVDGKPKEKLEVESESDVNVKVEWE